MGWYEDYGIIDGEVVSILAVAHVFRDSEGMRTGGPPSWSGCNPGNIEAGSFTDSHGGYPGKFIYRFAVFPDDQAGKAAIISLLKTPKYATQSIAGAMQTYAPHGDGSNNPGVYAEQIASAIGKPVETVVGTLNDDELAVYADRIEFVETHGSPQGVTYSFDQDLPSDVVDWLSTYPTPDERASADQPFCGPGAKGPGVACLQSWLVSLSELAAEDVVGSFGPKTTAAIKRVQARNGLTADAICGPDTWKAILAEVG